MIRMLGRAVAIVSFSLFAVGALSAQGTSGAATAGEVATAGAVAGSAAATGYLLSNHALGVHTDIRVSAPEISSAGAASALILIVGCALILRGRKREQM